jgi:hypothetical protein
MWSHGGRNRLRNQVRPARSRISRNSVYLAVGAANLGCSRLLKFVHSASDVGQDGILRAVGNRPAARLQQHNWPFVAGEK